MFHSIKGSVQDSVKRDAAAMHHMSKNNVFFENESM